MISWFEKHSKISWSIALFGAIIMFYISSLSFGGGEGLTNTNLLAILYHVLSFFFLSLFLGFAIIRGEYESLFFVTFLISIIYGITDEIHQYFVPGRHASVIDLGWDALGIFLSSAFYWISIKFRRRSSKSP